MSENTFNGNVLSGEAGRLLTALLGEANEIGRAQVSLTVLLKKSGLTQGALIRARNELTQQGLLRTEPGFSSSGLRGANVYVLNMTVIEPPSTPVLEGETGRTPTDDPNAPGHQVSDGLPASSGRHRSDRPGLWGRLTRRGRSS